MRSTFRLMPYINRAKTRADGTTAVMLRITIDGKKTVMATGIYCQPDKWDAKNGTITSPAKETNALRDLIKRAESNYQTFINEQGVASAELLKNSLNGTLPKTQTLMEMSEEEREKLKARCEAIRSIETCKGSNMCQMHLRDYLHSLGKEDIAFADITVQFGNDYRFFLKRTTRLSSVTINRCQAWMSRLVYRAVDKGILRSNPLEDMEYEKRNDGKNEAHYLTREQVRLLMSHPFEGKRMEFARRMLIFTIFTGLAYIDLKELYPTHIETNVDGQRFIRKARKKTGVEAFIPLHPVAEQILAMYNTTDINTPVFPFPRKKLWYEYDDMGKILGFGRHLAHHQGRHTFGTLLVSEGVSFESAAKMMGHSKIKTTQRYAQVTTKRISQEMDKLIQRRKEKGLTTAETIK
ncbi:MAG: site-specific integrase [Bacteroidales bacterium]|nr:site-specific integrase [Bacteroidales bacterium]